MTYCWETPPEKKYFAEKAESGRRLRRDCPSETRTNRNVDLVIKKQLPYGEVKGCKTPIPEGSVSFLKQASTLQSVQLPSLALARLRLGTWAGLQRGGEDRMGIVSVNYRLCGVWMTI